MAGYEIKYQASPTCAAFIKDRSPRKILAGPVGGGKTSACIMHLLLNAMQQAPDSDGIRRTRHLVVRNTVPMLKTTTIKSFLDWIPDGTLGRWVSSDKTYYMKFGDVEAEVLFMSLEDSNDIRKLLSLETTTVFFNEFREINPDIVQGMIGTKRIGRYPSAKAGPGPTYPCLMADTNMPAMDSWHQQVMDGIIPGFKLYKQPGGRSPQAENLSFLPPNYYDIEGLSDEYIRTMIDVEYGTSKEGLPVFKSSYIPSFHVATEPLKALASLSYPIIIGMDAGLTPAAILMQNSPSGRINVLGECYTPKGETNGMDRFCTVKLIPMLRARYPENSFLVVIDPAAFQRSQATEERVVDILAKHRLKAIPGPTQDPDLRIGSAETLFARQVQGKAGLLIDPSCVGLKAALQYGYKYAAKRDGELEEKPDKVHPDSDICVATDTPVLTPTGWVPADSLYAGDEIVAPGGVDRVVQTGVRFSPVMVRVHLSNGNWVDCTPDHPFKTHTGFLRADALGCGFVLEEPPWASLKAQGIRVDATSPLRVECAERVSLPDNGGSTKVRASIAQLSAAAKRLATRMASWLTACGSLEAGATGTTGTKTLSQELASHYTNMSGRNTMAQHPMTAPSTTRTGTQQTIHSTISSASPWKNTPGCISSNASPMEGSTSPPLYRKHERQPKNGIDPRKDGSGTDNMRSTSPISVVRVDYLPEGQEVVTLKTEREHVFYAGGVLTHNCDAFTYGTSFMVGSDRIINASPALPVVVSSAKGWT